MFTCAPALIAPVGDPNFANVSSLLHFDGANGSSTITDVKGKTWNVEGSATLSTAQLKFGTASLSLNGTTQAVNTASHADFVFGAGNFTIEGFVRLAALGASSAILLLKDDPAPATVGFSPYRIDLDNTGGINCFLSYAGTAHDLSVSSAASIIVANTWYHVALVRQGATVTLYVDGVSKASGAISTNALWSNTFRVLLGGRSHNGTSLRVNGFLDEWRITKGVARYTAAFTPPAAPFPNS